MRDVFSPSSWPLDPPGTMARVGGLAVLVKRDIAPDRDGVRWRTCELVRVTAVRGGEVRAYVNLRTDDEPELVVWGSDLERFVDLPGVDPDEAIRVYRKRIDDVIAESVRRGVVSEASAIADRRRLVRRVRPWRYAHEAVSALTPARAVDP